MFCAKCGFTMDEGVAFCPKCGTKTGTVGQSQITQTETTPKNTIKALRVLSIIGMLLVIWIPLFVLFGIGELVVVNVPVIFIYAIAHAIVAIVQGNKHKITVLTVMGIIGMIWNTLSLFFILGSINHVWDFSLSTRVILATFIPGLIYAIIFFIVAFVKSRIRR